MKAAARKCDVKVKCPNCGALLTITVKLYGVKLTEWAKAATPPPPTIMGKCPHCIDSFLIVFCTGEAN